jgi:hypothetical protein
VIDLRSLQPEHRIAQDAAAEENGGDLSPCREAPHAMPRGASQERDVGGVWLDAMAAISKVLAYSLLRWNEARFHKNLAHQGKLGPCPRPPGLPSHGFSVWRSALAS